MKVDVDELTGSAVREVIDVNDRPVKGKGMTPSISVVDSKKKILASYSLPSKSILMKNNSNKVAVGEFIARVPVEGTKTKDIIKPYYTTKEKGTGLGLSIVDKIINDHNGSIKFLNTNNGAKVQIIIPK